LAMSSRAVWWSGPIGPSRVRISIRRRVDDSLGESAEDWLRTG
jgi:hypothetical protein